MFKPKKDTTPVIRAGDADETEDQVELRDPKVRRFIKQGHEEYLAGKNRPAEELLSDLSQPRIPRSESTRRRKA